MAHSRRTAPDTTRFLASAAAGDKPLAVVLAGHNGSGKSTLWYDKLVDKLQIPLVNADRLTLSICPPPVDEAMTLRPWAATLRDADERWQKLSGRGPTLYGIDHGPTQFHLPLRRYSPTRKSKQIVPTGSLSVGSGSQVITLHIK